MFNDVIQFWFEDIDHQLWWEKNSDFDQLIRDRFLTLHQQAASGELFQWRESALGCLAEIIILDQFSRNMFRDTAQSFSYDGQALVLAQTAIARGIDKQLTSPQRSFLYLPFMHSESLIIHQQAEVLYKAHGVAANLEFELKHKRIIEQFSRYPHRNIILNRHSTEQEIAFLTQQNSHF